MSDKFKFYLPADIIKSTNPQTGVEEMKFKGIASTASKDSQSEYLDPSGFDLSAFRWINWNHKGKDDPSALIGEPTLAKITPTNELYIEGVLYPEMDKAKAAYALMKALCNSPTGNKLSMSVEGKVLQRGSDDKKSPLYNKIIKSKITAVALCPVPINGDTWADLLTKGVSDEAREEKYDEETQKAIEAVGSVITKESVEHKGEKRVLRKSDIYDVIYAKYPSIGIESAKSVYNLIERVAKMSKDVNKVSEETIKKSFEILDLASQEISKASKDDKKGDDEDEEMTEKAYGMAKDMKKSGDAKEAIKEKLLKKGFGELVVSKAIEKVEKEGSETSSAGLSKSEIGYIVKSEIEGLANSLDIKFKALGDILKSQTEENAELKKSLDSALLANEDLKKDIEKALTQPLGRKSTVKSYTDKFEKSADGKSSVFNIASPIDRKALKNKLEELSGINKGDGNFDQGLMRIAQDLEISKSVSTESLSRLESLDIKVVME